VACGNKTEAGGELVNIFKVSDLDSPTEFPELGLAIYKCFGSVLRTEASNFMLAMISSQN